MEIGHGSGPPSPEIDLDDAARRLGGPVLIADGSRIGGWEQHSIDNDLEYVELETAEGNDPLLVHTRRRVIPLRTLVSLLERHAQRCEIGEFGDIGMPEALSAVELMINGQSMPGHTIDGGTVSGAVARVGQVTVSLVASQTWLERHGGWPALVTAHGQPR